MHPVLLTAGSGPAHSLLLLTAGLVAAAGTVVALDLAGLDAVAAMRDGRLGESPEAGLISDLGILSMGIAGLAAAIGAATARCVPLGALAAFCWLFAVDDGAMIHEEVGAAWEVVIFAAYGLLAALVVILFTAARRRPPWPIVVAVAAFAASVLIDLAWMRSMASLDVDGSDADYWRRVGFVLEDLPKFAGILVISSCAIGEALSIRRDRTVRGRP